MSTVRRIVKSKGDEDKKKDTTKTQNNRRVGRPQKLDNFDLDIIDRAMRGLFAKRQVVTIRRLKAHLRTSFELDLSYTTLWRAVKKKGEYSSIHFKK